MTSRAVLLATCLLTTAVSASEPAMQTRGLLYPQPTAEGQRAPEVRVSVDGTPTGLYFPDALLDERAALHFVSTPGALALRVAERTAFVQAVDGAVAGHRAVLTLTLAEGRPLTFAIRVVDAGADADASVVVKLEAARGPTGEARVQQLEDELARCREEDETRSLQAVARHLLGGRDDAAVVEHRDLGWRDKQSRIYVEVRDAVRVGSHTFLRLTVENRDGGGKSWSAGEAAAVIEGPSRREVLPVVALFERQATPSGGSTRGVLVVETPQRTRGVPVRITVAEREGGRHLVLERLEL